MILGDPLAMVQFSERVCRLFNGGNYIHDMKTKVIWHKLPGFKLKATWTPGPRGFELGLKEADMDPIHEWSKKQDCGVRVSFDMWRFRSPEEMTMFLLKWS
jgi:hypothetical protein